MAGLTETRNGIVFTRKFDYTDGEAQGMPGSTVLPSAKAGTMGGSEGIDTNKLLPFNVIGESGEILAHNVDPTRVAGAAAGAPDALSVYKGAVEREHPGGAGALIPPATTGGGQVEPTQAILGVTDPKPAGTQLIPGDPNAMPTPVGVSATQEELIRQAPAVQVKPAYKVKFCGVFGEILGTYHDVFISDSNDVCLVLVYDNRQGGGYIYRPPMLEDELEVIVEASEAGVDLPCTGTYRARSVGINFGLQDRSLTFSVLLILGRNDE